MLSPIRMRGFSEAKGSWKIVWMLGRRRDEPGYNDNVSRPLYVTGVARRVFKPTGQKWRDLERCARSCCFILGDKGHRDCGNDMAMSRDIANMGWRCREASE